MKDDHAKFQTTITCRKCGAVGTNHCSMPGCPLPPLNTTKVPHPHIQGALMEVPASPKTTVSEAANTLAEARMLVQEYLLVDDDRLTTAAIRLKRHIARAIVEAATND